MNISLLDFGVSQASRFGLGVCQNYAVIMVCGILNKLRYISMFNIFRSVRVSFIVIGRITDSSLGTDHYTVFAATHTKAIFIIIQYCFTFMYVLYQLYKHETN